jgi:hypothetical protein
MLGSTARSDSKLIRWFRSTHYIHLILDDDEEVIIAPNLVVAINFDGVMQVKVAM